ncbi:hypothetical protein GCM10028805_62920 [Spirosoma harenae]
MGRQIALLECIGLIAVFEILFIPTVTYWVSPASMPIPSASYFSYALPACALFYISMHWVGKTTQQGSHKVYIELITPYLQHRQSVGIILFFIGLAGFVVKLVMPTAPTFIGTLPMHCLLTSSLYIYYARIPYQLPLIGLIISLLLVNTVRTGMFGDLAYWLLLLMIFAAVRFRNPLMNRTKLIAFGVGFVSLILIQSIKGEYRSRTWSNKRTERSADTSLMVELLINRISRLDKLFTASRFFISFARFNQGLMIGNAMAKVPAYEPYASGEILLSFLYPFVPRLLWTDKPQTGGYENIRRFTTLPQYENTSINLSPIGEGYVNFGYGGILFSGLYGVILGGFFRLVFRLASAMPSAILWLPMLFLGCLTMETDLLSTWGSLANSALFIVLLYGLLKLVGIDL